MPANPITVIYHADCADGFGAAYAAWRGFGDTAAYRPIHHGQPLEIAEIAGHEVYILDFSFSPDKLVEIASVASSVVQIDHHASARRPWVQHLAPAADGSEYYRHPALPLTLCFNLDNSGARLAWEHFHPAQPVPLILCHIEDLDIWRFALPGTRAVSRALRLLDFDFALWDELMRTAPTPDSPRYKALLAAGESIECFFQTEIDRLAQSRLVMPARLRGEPLDPLQALRHGLPTVVEETRAWRAISGLAINANALFASELGDLLAKRSGSFGLIWQLGNDGQVKASLRARGKIDVAEIAANYGGGGHPNAAGFRMPLARFAREILGK